MIESTGTFEVDGFPISTVPRSLVRRKCFIAIPQDGVMFRDESLRFNLDPTATVDDKDLKSALEKARLWQTLSARSTGTTSELLDQELSSLPPLSMGQSQLFAVARAIVQNYSYAAAGGYSDDDSYPDQPKPLLLLDEITSSMDSGTENAVLDTIESEFVENGHTVIIVSHRLGGLEGRLRPGVDSVAVLRDGRLTIESDIGKIV
jgi:ABC-type multidrug transport system fused ATPase/permease subunit